MQAVFTTSKPVSEQYGTKVLNGGQTAPAGAQTATTTYRGKQVTVVRGLLPLGSPVRLTTPFFNIYGLLTLVGGAIWSAYLFWRKRVLPNRVIGNVLIAAGRPADRLGQHADPPGIRTVPLPRRAAARHPHVRRFPLRRPAAAGGGPQELSPRPPD